MWQFVTTISKWVSCISLLLLSAQNTALEAASGHRQVNGVLPCLARQTEEMNCKLMHHVCHVFNVINFFTLNNKSKSTLWARQVTALSVVHLTTEKQTFTYMFRQKNSFKQFLLLCDVFPCLSDMPPSLMQYLFLQLCVDFILCFIDMLWSVDDNSIYKSVTQKNKTIISGELLVCFVQLHLIIYHQIVLCVYAFIMHTHTKIHSTNILWHFIHYFMRKAGFSSEEHQLVSCE